MTGISSLNAAISGTSSAPGTYRAMGPIETGLGSAGRSTVMARTA